MKSATDYSATANDPRWASVVARDIAADGSFYYSVRTTGIYCRPSCPSRRPRPENVCFHASPAEAETSGFRPCERCKPCGPAPAQRHAMIVTEACRIMDEATSALALPDLARLVGMSAYHFHRLFKKLTGVTPRQYAAAKREQRLRDALGQSNTVTEAMFDAGFNSAGRFYEESKQLLGMTPTSYRAGGVNAEIRFAVGKCSLGSILVAQSGRGICAIFLGEDPEELARQLRNRFPRAKVIRADREFELIVAKVVDFVEAPRVGLSLPLDIRGTAFQRRVWEVLREIPVGTTATYANIANLLGSHDSARAVAGACAANPLAVAIPCHRVILANGKISGYRWGVERKRKLLAKEVLL